MEESGDGHHLDLPLINENNPYYFRQQTSVSKWIYRKLRKFILLQSWPNFILFSLIILLVFFILSSHLYLLIQSPPLSDSSSLSKSEKKNYSRYMNELSLEKSHSSYHLRAAQINEQLRKIESSLQENRQILQSIRNSINIVKSNVTNNNHNPQKQHDNQLANQIWVEDFFYEKISSNICPKPYQSFSGDINMEHVYDLLPFDNLDGGVWKQGWPIEIKNEDFKKPKPKLKVFIVPHSHNDPGWIKTFDAYFSKQTKPILTNAVEYLSENPDMRFIWAETSYLSAWWETTDKEHKQMMQRLVREGRLEIVTGGWVMNDEANTHYWSILAQMIEGHEWIQNTIGMDSIPKHGWAIDPFGLSPTMAYLLKLMGFRAMVIQRVHYSIKKHLAQNHNLEFRWRQHWESDDAIRINQLSNQPKDILCHVEPFYSYDIPHTCGPDPMICCQFDFKRLPPGKPKCPWKVNPQVITEDNVEERAQTLLDQYRKKSRLYKTNSLLVPLGDDFRYDDVKEWKNQYENYRKLINYLNNHEEFNVEIKFSTLKDYFDSISNDYDVEEQFSSLVGDFFTYADRDDHYWSGYYTSKPFYKRFERILATHLRATEILFSLANILTENITSLNEDPFNHLLYEYMFARQNLALFQHHDGITGTAKDSVVVDYANRMLRSFTILELVSTSSLAAIFNRSIPELEFMHSFHSIATPTKKYSFRLDPYSRKYFILYNTLGWALDSQTFCFDIYWTNENDTMPDFCLTETDPNQKGLIKLIQINHVWSQFPSSSMQLIEKHREVCFQPRMNPLSLVQYCIGNCRCSPVDKNGYSHHEKHESFVTLYNNHKDSNQITKPLDYHILSLVHLSSNITIENEMIRLTFDSSVNGLLKSWSYYDLDQKQWITLDLTMKIMTFGTRSGGKKVQKSGAYIFLPDNSEPTLLEWIGKPRIRLMIGNMESRYEWIINEPYPIHIRFSLYSGRSSVDFSTEFHLQGQHAANRELLIRFEIPKINNQDRFYTDLNGLQIISRKRFQKIPIQGNVYPMSTMAWIEDDEYRFSVITGQPLGVTSLNPGNLEIFMDRRLTQDDFRGLNQGVMDNRHTRESFRLMLEPIKSDASRTNPDSPSPTSGMMFESQTLINPVIGLVSKSIKDESTLMMNGSSLNLLKRSFPCDLLILNLRRSISKHTEYGLWLHRSTLNCDSKCLLHQQNDNTEINLSHYLSEHILQKLEPRIYSTSITMLTNNTSDQESNSQSLNEILTILPMQIKTYKLFKSKKFVPIQKKLKK